MTFDPASPVDWVDEQLRVNAIADAADQAALAGGTSVGGGQFLMTPYGLLVSPDGGFQGQPSDGDVWQGFSWGWQDVNLSWANVFVTVVATSGFVILPGQQLTFTGGGVVYFGTPVEVCDVLIWCAADLELVSFSTQDLDLPDHRKVVLRLSTAADAQITGMVPAVTNQVVCLVNTSAWKVALTHEDPASAGGSRFHLPAGANLTLVPGGSVVLWWDDFSGRWYALSESGTPASPTQPGWVTTTDQHFGGHKTFDGGAAATFFEVGPGVAGPGGLSYSITNPGVGQLFFNASFNNGGYVFGMSPSDVAGASVTGDGLVFFSPGRVQAATCFCVGDGPTPSAKGRSGTTANGDTVTGGIVTAIAPAVPPTGVTGSRGGNAALASLLTALAARGIITDGTTP